ncbi:LysR family transcriptional regulator [Marinobacterium sp. D7]|uniref:LysR family transcriptional regulator n=1 Tax=Marinobacterium ramblicola TaxID=2849041 RepID=UPI001C2DC858|nr:LysR family transcriptional regulator [Marinobacterium ramblicola]MBV1789037.1 LysR family transcriptional regulator [Marinobacterium ramblicola]
MDNLRRLDLNLLVTLDTLLTEHNVTRAAQRLHMSQPTVSVHLAKLREFFDDPLLIPGPRGVLPTQRANELREPLRQALEALEYTVSPASPFDPGTADNTWCIAATDYGESAVVQPTLKGLRSAAPGTRLAVVEMAPSRIAKQAAQGEIDIAFHISHEAPPGLRHRVLFQERYVLVGRAGHPSLKKPPTLQQFCDLEHVIVSPDGGGFSGVADKVLLEAGLTRRVVLSVPHFLFVVSVVTSTDLVAMLPERLVIHNPLVKIVDSPIEIPGFEMCMLWHERSHRDPAHQWLREQIVSASRQ